MISIDGIQWNVPVDIERVSEMTASEISGLLLDKSYFNDVIGTYLRYTVTIVVPLGFERDYTRLYEAITEPVDAHAFILPYNNDQIAVTGRVNDISDVYVRMPNGQTHWKGIKFSITSNAPNKTYTLGEAIARGLAPLPETGGAQVGQLYEYNGSEWEEVTFDNADVIPY